MKVLFINTVCGRGSTGRIIRDIDCLLRENGDESLTLFGRYEAPEDMNAIRVETDFGNKIHVLWTRFFDRQGFMSKKATQKMISAIEEYKPDVIHIHNIHGYYLNLPTLFKYLAKKDIPIVWTFHDCWPYTGHCVYSDFIGCEKWKTQCYKCPKKNTYPQSLFFDSSRKNYKDKKKLFTSLKNLTIVTVSDWLKGEVEKSFMGKYPIKRIYNGIDRTTFTPRDSDIREKLGVGSKFLMLGVSDRWSERTGDNYFYQLAKELKPDEAIVMIGFKKDELSNVPKNIIALERTDSVEELVQLYSAADVVLNPSYEQTFGLVTAEAMCCGTPVVVLDATASPELVDNSCGIVVPKGDYNAFKQAIAKIKENPLRLEDCVKRTDLFDKTINYKEYVELYHQLVKGE